MKRLMPWMAASLALYAAAFPAMAATDLAGGDAPQQAVQSAAQAQATTPTPAPAPNPLDTLRQAAQQGDAAAQNKLGDLYANGQQGMKQDYRQAARWYRQAALQGNAQAQNSLGSLYANGQGVRQNYVKAAHWYEKAAAQGVAPAQVELGILYSDGRGVGRDYQKARQWLIKAADQGNANAMTSLGILYELGLGVRRNRVTAYALYMLAVASGGHQDAVHYRDRLHVYINRAARDKAKDLMQQMLKAKRVTAVIQP